MLVTLAMPAAQVERAALTAVVPAAAEPVARPARPARVGATTAVAEVGPEQVAAESARLAEPAVVPAPLTVAVASELRAELAEPAVVASEPSAGLVGLVLPEVEPARVVPTAVASEPGAELAEPVEPETATAP